MMTKSNNEIIISSWEYKDRDRCSAEVWECDLYRENGEGEKQMIQLNNSATNKQIMQPDSRNKNGKLVKLQIISIVECYQSGLRQIQPDGTAWPQSDWSMLWINKWLT